MRILRVLTTTLALLAIYTITTSCTDFLVPCDQGGFKGSNKKGFLDDIWTISTVGGAPLPAKGFPIPNSNPQDYLLGGSIELKSRENTGTCDDVKTASGIAIANYLIGDGNQPKFPGSSAAGSFDYNVGTGLITLHAFNKDAPGFISAGEKRMTFIGPVIEDEIPSLITIVFARAGS